MRDDLTAASAQGEVQLAPLPLDPVVPGSISLALAERLQAVTLQHQVHEIALAINAGLAAGESATRPGHGGVMGTASSRPSRRSALRLNTLAWRRTG